MSAACTVVGLAIVSEDDRIADAAGAMPASLRNDADWRRFQAELDKASLVVLGRLGHEAHANTKQRPRMVVSSRSSGLERRSDAWWWNPARLSWADALARAAPQGGIIAVPGGQGVFDLFLELGYDAFHLTRAHGVTIPNGRTLFSGLSANRTAEAVLAGRGLLPGPAETIDPAGPVTLTVWRRVRSGA
ncbi:hypothetical protein NK718_12690 [Alsobacter sp. SYSU M60028]|uniref:Dihydrofolate reductase n=1 Tax=Alsobacter ponti TaxID=2962936 RepID=A0ABT1LD00_9HYPH|nr:hypothetical protein [Alsobacter ponti]